MAGLSATQFFNSQVRIKLPTPTKKLTGRTIIVTGSNAGMGLEAARLFVRLDAEKVILAVRTLAKGEEAKKSIEHSENRMGVLEVWELDLASYASVKDFAARAETLKRLDVVIENAAVFKFEYSTAEDNEVTVTVNIISTFLLAFLLLPKLRETSVRYSNVPVLTFTGSFTHAMVKFPERKAEKIFQELNRKDASFAHRYSII
jgi:NAD(P)-dependent dehydrogenase (short-subunit alcohol dehydrogenase family)